MRTRAVLTLALLTAVALADPAPAAAQCATPTKKLAAALNGKDAYTAARAEATKWKADSALIRMQSTMAGPLDATGHAGHWMLEFYSKSSKKLEVVNVMKGDVSCSVSDVEIAAEPVAVAADAILDTQRLRGIAQQAGGSAQDSKHPVVTARLEQGADHGAMWTVTYASPQGMPLLTVKIDATSGAVIPKAPGP
jgi:hypothetical protein